MPTFIIVTPEALSPFTRPALDLQTGQLIELEPDAPVQLELPLTMTKRGEMAQPPAGGIDTGSQQR